MQKEKKGNPITEGPPTLRISQISKPFFLNGGVFLLKMNEIN